MDERLIMNHKTMIVMSDKADPYMNLAAEELLTEYRKSSDRCLFLWQSENAVVIGRHQNPWKECPVDILKAEEVSLVRRKTGGGAVYQDLGNVNYSIMTENTLENAAAGRYLFDSLERLNVKAHFSGRNDILIDNKKISGQAYLEKPGLFLCHGTLMVSVDKDKLERYLKVSPEKLKAKGIDSVRARVANLTEFCPDLTTDRVSQTVAAAFAEGWQDAVSFSLEEALREVVGDDYEKCWRKKTEAYREEAWIFGRYAAMGDDGKGDSYV